MSRKIVEWFWKDVVALSKGLQLVQQQNWERIQLVRSRKWLKCCACSILSHRTVRVRKARQSHSIRIVRVYTMKRMQRQEWKKWTRFLGDESLKFLVHGTCTVSISCFRSGTCTTRYKYSWLNIGMTVIFKCLQQVSKYVLNFKFDLMLLFALERISLKQ